LISSPIAKVAITTVNSGARMIGRISARSMTMPPTAPTSSTSSEHHRVRQRQRGQHQRDICAGRDHLALAEIEDARGLERNDDRQGDESIDAPDADPGDRQLKGERDRHRRNRRMARWDGFDLLIAGQDVALALALPLHRLPLTALDLHRHQRQIADVMLVWRTCGASPPGRCDSPDAFESP
jgi:hypothetical protein